MGSKHDTGKRRWHLLNPMRPHIEAVVDVLMGGAERHGANNWQTVESWRYTDAMERHLYKYVAGEKIDPDFGLPHLAHLICSALFLMWQDANPTITQLSAATTRFKLGEAVLYKYIDTWIAMRVSQIARHEQAWKYDLKDDHSTLEISAVEEDNLMKAADQ